MLSRELRLAAVVTGVCFLLSFVSYRILLTGTYLDGIAALGLVILATVVSSLVLHFRKTAPLPAANPVVEAASATVAVLAAALCRLIALVIFMGAHYGLNHAFEFVVPSNMKATLMFTEDIIYVAFVIIYVYLAFDILRVFMPRLGGKVAQSGTDN